MITISVCMIVKDEEAVLGRCLDSLAGLADEKGSQKWPADQNCACSLTGHDLPQQHPVN